MVRLLLALSIAVPCIAVPDAYPIPRPERYTLRQFGNAQVETALNMSSMVRMRFFLSGVAIACRQDDDLQAYNLLLSKFDDDTQKILQSAADDGYRDGAASGARCDDAAANLRSLDRSLLARAAGIHAPS